MGKKNWYTYGGEEKTVLTDKTYVDSNGDEIICVQEDGQIETFGWVYEGVDDPRLQQHFEMMADLLGYDLED